MAGSGEKSEKATPQRLREARKRGEIASSPELAMSLVALVGLFALQAQGTVLKSPRWNVVTNPALESGAELCRPIRKTTPATMSTTTSAATPQTQVIRDLRRERAAALRLREPGAGSAAQPGRSVSSSCQAAA